MSPAEADEIYDQLVGVLRDLGLEWIVQQVEDQLSLGHIETRKLTVEGQELFASDELMYEPAPRRRRSKATFVVSRPFESPEKLRLLIDSIEIGIVHVTEIASEVSTFFGRETHTTQVEFRPETDLGAEFDLDAGDVEGRISAAASLRAVLAELRREVADAD
jgi:hypothetical protein